jgi:hypothetical protein
MDQPPAPQAVLAFLSCGCVALACSTNRCTCWSNQLPCTDLCKCSEKCENKAQHDESDNEDCDEDDSSADEMDND